MDLTVRANWDAQASVWVAESDDVPGLITEADDLEALMSKLDRRHQSKRVPMIVAEPSAPIDETAVLSAPPRL